MNKVILGILGLMVGFAGACVIGYNSNFNVAVGVFLILWGNNIQNSLRNNNHF
jgi:hypothetical protein